MKLFIRFSAVTAIILGFVFLKSFFFGWEVLAQKAVDTQDSEKLFSKLIESACREDGIVTKCFNVTPKECAVVQLGALDRCVSNDDKAIGTMDRVTYVNYINKVSSCGFKAFLNKHMDNLNTGLEECRNPDMANLFEVEKVLAQLKK